MSSASSGFTPLTTVYDECAALSICFAALVYLLRFLPPLLWPSIFGGIISFLAGALFATVVGVLCLVTAYYALTVPGDVRSLDSQQDATGHMQRARHDDSTPMSHTSRTVQATGRLPCPAPRHSKSGSFSGWVYLIPGSRWPRGEVLAEFPPQTAGPNAIAQRWFASLKRQTLSLRSEPSQAAAEVVIQLEGSSVRIVMEGLRSGSTPWLKKGPLELRHPTRALWQGAASIIMFAEHGAAKEQWYLALSYSLRPTSSLAQISDMYSLFCAHMRQQGLVPFPRASEMEAAAGAGSEQPADAEELAKSVSRQSSLRRRSWFRFRANTRERGKAAQLQPQALPPGRPSSSSQVRLPALDPDEVDKMWMSSPRARTMRRNKTDSSRTTFTTAMDLDLADRVPSGMTDEMAQAAAATIMTVGDPDGSGFESDTESGGEDGSTWTSAHNNFNVPEDPPARDLSRTLHEEFSMRELVHPLPQAAPPQPPAPDPSLPPMHRLRHSRTEPNLRLAASPPMVAALSAPPNAASSGQGASTSAAAEAEPSPAPPTTNRAAPSLPAGQVQIAGLHALNMFLARAAFELLQSQRFEAALREMLQRKLDDIRRPSYLHRLQLVNLDLGNSVPVVRGMHALPTPGSSIWPQLQLDIAYTGHFSCTIETKVELQRAAVWEKIERTLQSLQGEQDLQESPSSPPEDHEMHAAVTSVAKLDHSASMKASAAALAAAEASADKGRKKRNILGMIPGVRRAAASTLRQLADNIAESLSKVTFQLYVRLSRLEGTMLLWVAPPPSDRLWMSFVGVPQLELMAKPVISSRFLKYSAMLARVSRWFELKLLRAMQKHMVFPSCFDIRLPLFADADRSSGPLKDLGILQDNLDLEQSEFETSDGEDQPGEANPPRASPAASGPGRPATSPSNSPFADSGLPPFQRPAQLTLDPSLPVQPKMQPRLSVGAVSPQQQGPNGLQTMSLMSPTRSVPVPLPSGLLGSPRLVGSSTLGRPPGLPIYLRTPSMLNSERRLRCATSRREKKERARQERERAEAAADPLLVAKERLPRIPGTRLIVPAAKIAGRTARVAARKLMNWRPQRRKIKIMDGGPEQDLGLPARRHSSGDLYRLNQVNHHSASDEEGSEDEALGCLPSHQVHLGYASDSLAAHHQGCSTSGSEYSYSGVRAGLWEDIRRRPSAQSYSSMEQLDMTPQCRPPQPTSPKSLAPSPLSLMGSTSDPTLGAQLLQPAAGRPSTPPARQAATASPQRSPPQRSEPPHDLPRPQLGQGQGASRMYSSDASSSRTLPSADELLGHQASGSSNGQSITALPHASWPAGPSAPTLHALNPSDHPADAPARSLWRKAGKLRRALGSMMSSKRSPRDGNGAASGGSGVASSGGSLLSRRLTDELEPVVRAARLAGAASSRASREM